MKRILLILMILLLLVGCTPKEETLGTYYTISVSDLMDKMDNGDEFVVYLGLSTCGSCATYKSVIEEYIKNYDTDFYYVELDNESEEMIELLGEEYLKGIENVPVTFILDGKETLDRKVGIIEYRALKDFLFENGYATE